MKAIIFLSIFSLGRLAAAYWNFDDQLTMFPGGQHDFWGCNMSPNLHPDGEYSYHAKCDPPVTNPNNSISCDGSLKCDILARDGFNYIKIMKDFVEAQVVDHVWSLSQTFKTAGHAVCVNGVCAQFTRGYDGNAGEMITGLQAMINYGCTVCGQFPADARDMARGGLIVQYTQHPFHYYKWHSSELIMGELDLPNNDQCNIIDDIQRGCY